MDELETRLNNELSKKKKILNIIYSLASISGILFLIFFISAFEKKNLLIICIPVIISTILIIYGINYKNRLLKYLKNNIFFEILPKIFENKKTIYNENGISRIEFDKSQIYVDYNKYYTSDSLRSITNDFCIANVTAIKDSNEDKITRFIGIFGFCELEEFYENEIIIKPDIKNKYAKNVIDSKERMLGNNENVIRLENNEFERNFEVYSKAPIKARQVLTTNYMEKLLNVKNKLGATIKIIYKGNRKYIAIWDKRIIDEKMLYRNGVKIKDIENKIEGICELLYM